MEMHLWNTKFCDAKSLGVVKLQRFAGRGKWVSLVGTRGMDLTNREDL